MAKLRKRFGRDTLIVATDISKDTHYARARTPFGDETDAFRFDNGRAGYEAFYELMLSYQRKHQLPDMAVFMEPTSVYGLGFQEWLSEQDVPIYLINPMHVKRTKEFQDNTPNKNDPKDTRIMLDLVSLGAYRTRVLRDEQTQSLCLAMKRYRQQKKEIIQLQNRLHTFVFQLFPEYLKVMNGLNSKSSMLLLTRCCSPSVVRNMKVSEISSDLKRMSRGQLGMERAQALYEAAQTSVGTKIGVAELATTIAEFVELYEVYQRQLVRRGKRVKQCLAQHPLAALFMSVKGLGWITAATLLGEAGDWRNYRNADSLIKLAGLNLYQIKSGKFVGKVRISKRGRKGLRLALHQVAVRLIRVEGIFKQAYERHLSNHMAKMQAVVAVAKKLVRVLFAMARDNQPFQLIENSQPYMQIAA